MIKKINDESININIALAVFNMIPGFPMDGGRGLRGIIWAITGDGAKATRIASVTGQFLAFGFIILGLFMFFSGAGFGGLWIAFIGWFLLSAARSSYAQVEMTRILKDRSVGDVMLPLERLRTIAPEMPVTEALELMGREDVNQLPVMRDGLLKGIISRGNIVRLLHTQAELNL